MATLTIISNRIASTTAAFTEFAEAMQAEGPFVPMIVPGRNISSADSVKGAVYNSVWEMDIAEITPAG